jgi:HD-GYP domain-containing protein (c-di-GMP phosphodiesterase class II)
VGISEPELDAVAFGALLHDVGRIGNEVSRGPLIE